MNLRMGHPAALVDVCRIPELQQLSMTPDGSLHVGAGVRQADVLADREVGARWPMLRRAISEIGHPQIRSRGTVCGSIAHADPAAELPAVALALDATMVVRSRRGERRIAAEEFVLAPFTTVLEENEILIEVVFPPAGADSGWAFEEFATRRGDFATAGAAVRLVAGAGAVIDCRLALFGVGGRALRLSEAEEAVVGRPVDEEVLAAVHSAVESGLDPSPDVHASGEFRRELAARLAVSTIERAWERSNG
uniref:FAD binding domain-containing protein n=1 Tax=Nocardioides terrisoli TaxID=3388267 RepID=UPI0037C5180E